MRLAWFTPWPPQSSGVAGRSAELVPELAVRGHAIDVFVDEQLVAASPAGASPPQPGDVRVQSAHDFVWRAARGQYDLSVYQAGNSRLHQFVWPYLFRFPGLTVLHETRLHHARGHALLSRGRRAAYRAEFAWSHPHSQADAAELAVAGFDGAFYYDWPMVRSVLAASRRVVAHSRGAAEALRAEWPEYDVGHVALGEGRGSPIPEDDRRRRRAELGVPDDVVLYGIFGGLTEEKRVRQVLAAFRTTLTRLPDARLVLCGAADPSLDLDRQIDRAGVRPAVIVAGKLNDEDFDRTIAASDVTLNLRWPSAGEVSGAWLRALAAGRATVIVDLAQQAGIPTLDPRSMQAHAPAPTRIAPPVAVAVDILDEVHSLGLAMWRLGERPAVRAELGRAGRAWWEAHHTLAHMVRDYETAFDAAVGTTAPGPELPADLRPNPAAPAIALAAAIDEASATRLEELCRFS